MLLAGSILDRAPGRKYSQALGFAELTLRAPLPKAGTLGSWRAALPPSFQLALRAPRSAIVSKMGPLRADAVLEASLAWVIAAADALQVRAVVLPTPADLTPGARSCELLARYVERLPRSAQRSYVWSPSGVWEPEDTNDLCAQLELVRAFDPLQMPRPTGSVVYAELRAMGHRSGFSHAALEDALAVIHSAETSEAFVTVDATKSFEVAKRLQQIAAESGLSGFAADGASAGDSGAQDDDVEDDGEDEDESEDDEGDEDE